MNELKPEDVMRALECCTINQSCDGCPMFGEEPEADCNYYVMSCALALLREKDAEIERLQKIADAVADSFPVCEGCEGKNEWGERTEDCVYNIDDTFCAQRATKMWFALRGENEELHKEVERLQDIVAETSEYNEAWVKDNGELRKALKAARADAINEVLERAEKIGTPICNTWCVTRGDLTKIAKEMKEEQE